MKPPFHRHSVFSIRYSVLICLFGYSLIRLFGYFVPPAYADPWWRKTPTEQVRNIEKNTPPNEVDASKYNAFQVNTTFNNISAGILDPTGINKQAAVPVLGNAIAFIAGNPPVQTGEYLAYMASKAGFIEPAYAQGKGGFDVLKPVQKIWIATRNVAYLVTSLTLVVIGFMIMLRKKIDAQTVIGVQQALPKLVVTLLLVTFSYAIAGLVIDMIYFLIIFGVKLLSLPGSSIFADSPAGSNAINLILKKPLFSIGLGRLFSLTGDEAAPAGEAATAVGDLIQNLLSAYTGEGTVSAFAGIISAPIAYIIFAVAILYALFKLFFSLLMAYVQIVLLTILGPLQIMLNAMPGSDSFSKWFRNLLANALAFPAAAMMLVFAAATMGLNGDPWYISPDVGYNATRGGVSWSPPLVFGEGVSTSNPVNALLALFGIGVLLMTPKVVDMVKEWVQAPEFKYGSAIGEAVGFGYKTPMALYGKKKEYSRTLESMLAQQQQKAFFQSGGTAAPMPTATGEHRLKALADILFK